MADDYQTGRGINYAGHQDKTADGPAKGPRGNNTPKDASSILKKEYAARQKEKQPDTKGPVQYATDRVETTGRRGTVAAADGMRRVAKNKTRSRNLKIRFLGNTAETAEFPQSQGYQFKLADSRDLKIRSLEKPLSTSKNPTEHFAQTGSVSQSIPQERGRHKAIGDAKATRHKARNLAAKENIIVPRTPGAKAEGRQVAKHHSATVKRGTASPKHNAPVPLKQTAAQRAK